jgi:hypothetical protein
LGLGKAVQKKEGTLMSCNGSGFLAKLSVVFVLFSIGVLWEAQSFGQDCSATQKDVWGTEVPKESGVIISFRGGNIDNNLLRLYNYLYSKGRLPVKCLGVPKGLTLEETLIEEKILFKYYPADFDKFLVELNRQNPDVKIRTNRRGTKEVVYQPNSRIIVPDIRFEKYEYLTAIELSGTPLVIAAREKNLIWGYEPNRYALQLPANEEKKKKLVDLNPDYVATDITAVKHGRILFPADGFRGSIPLTLEEIKAVARDPQLQKLLKENVYIKQATRPNFNSYTNSKSPHQTPTAGLAPLNKCQDAFDCYVVFGTYLSTLEAGV